MDEFHLITFDHVANPKHKFYLLYKNGKCQFEEFIASLTQKSDKEEMMGIIASMDKVDGNNLPQSKYRHISSGRGSKRRKDVYEFKSKHLRIYVIKKEPDYYVVLGGFKKDQDKDIDTVFRRFNDLPEDIEILDGSEDNNLE